MNAFELHIPETAGWRALLTRAEVSSGICLDDDLENYLIYLLLRHVGAPTTAYDGLASGFLTALFAQGADGAENEDLAAIGDQCLLFAGLFPEQAANQMIPVSYFVQVGSGSYERHGEVEKDPLFARLAESFVDLMDLLQCLRDLDKSVYCLDALSAYEQWQNTGSTHAYNVLKALSPGMPAACQMSDAVN